MKRTNDLLILTLLMAFLGIPSALAQIDESWTFSDDGGTNYILSSSGSVSSPELYPGPFPANDPTINLTVGQRYQVTVVNASAHPFQLLAKADSFASDIILPSQGATVGTLEGDAGINWTDDGLSTNGSVAFTMTQALLTAMGDNAGGIARAPGYRCQVHPSTMRGDLSVQVSVEHWYLY